MYFVWIKTAVGCTPQKWYADFTDAVTGKFKAGSVMDINIAVPGDLVRFERLNREQADMSVDELAKLFPAPQRTSEPKVKL